MAGSLPPEIVIPPETPQDLKERVRPQPSALQGDQGRDGASGSTLRPDPTAAQGGARKKRSHRGGKKKRIRRQSFAAPSDDGSGLPETSQSRVDVHIQGVARSNSFYRLQRNLSNTSIESETLLDHRYGLYNYLLQTSANAAIHHQRPAIDETSKIIYHGPSKF
jgi:magnesium transporter